jgi:hypothetical protein
LPEREAAGGKLIFHRLNIKRGKQVVVDIDPAEHGTDGGGNRLRQYFVAGKNRTRSGHGERLQKFSARSAGIERFFIGSAKISG